MTVGDPWLTDDQGFTGPPYPRALTHVGLPVSDLDGAVRWYQEVLSFRVVFGPVDLVSDETDFGRICQDLFGSAFGKGRLMHMTGANGVVIEVFEFERPKSIAPDMEQRLATRLPLGSQPSRAFQRSFKSLSVLPNDISLHAL